MLNAFQLNDIERIRSNFSDNLLFNTLQDACRDCCERPKVFRFLREHVFVEVVRLLDELKQEQEDVQWDNLYRDLRQDYRPSDQTLPDEELDSITCTIVYALASLLAIAIPRYYNSLSTNLFCQVAHYAPESFRKSFEDARDIMMDKIEKNDKELRQWLNDYMQSDDFLSDDLERFISSIQTKGKYITFTKNATNAQRAEFMAVLKRIIEEDRVKGKAQEIKNILVLYRSDGIIVLSGNDTDIFNELNEVYHANISHSAFFRATPRLT